MCRYAGPSYKAHYACFRCRIAFKRRLKKDVDPTGPERPPRCSRCGRAVADMGLDFAAPKQTDTKAWTALERLFEAGVTFHSCGCTGPGFRPREPRDLRRFYERTLGQYRKMLRYWEQASPGSRAADEGRRRALETWRHRIERLERALRRVT